MNGGKFWDGPIYQVVKRMKATGNAPGLIRQWKALVEQWATRTNSPDAESVKAMLPLWQERQVYSAAELAPMFPALAATFGVQHFSGYMPPAMAPARLANALRFAGLPHREIDGTIFFAVEQIHHWRIAPDEAWKEEFSNAQHG